MNYRSTRDGITVEIEPGALDRPDCNCVGTCPDCAEEETS